jgi:hypothetical protein
MGKPTKQATAAAVAIEKFLAAHGAPPSMIRATMKSLALFSQPREHSSSFAAQLGAVLYALRFERPITTSDADDIAQYRQARASAQVAVRKILGSSDKLRMAWIYGALNAVASALADESNKHTSELVAPAHRSRSAEDTIASSMAQDQQEEGNTTMDPMGVRSDGVLAELLGPNGDGSDDSDTNLGGAS